MEMEMEIEKEDLYMSKWHWRIKEINFQNGIKTPLEEIERNIIVGLANIEFFIEMSIKNNEPHHLANYLYEISNLFNTFYQDTNIKNLKDEDKKITKITITYLFIKYSNLVMKCLGIEPVEKM